MVFFLSASFKPIKVINKLPALKLLKLICLFHEVHSRHFNGFSEAVNLMQLNLIGIGSSQNSNC